MLKDCVLCGRLIEGYSWSGGVAYHFNGDCPPPKPLTEEDVRRIVRDEIELSRETEREH